MRNVFITIVTIFLVNCKTQKESISIPPMIEAIKVLQISDKTACGNEDFNLKKHDSWYNEKYIDKNSKLYDVKFSKKISTVKKEYTIRNGILYFKNNKVDSIRLFYQQNENIGLILDVLNGRTKGYTINVNDNPRPSMYEVTYYENGDIKYQFIEREIFLPKGSGIFKNYYYSHWNGKTQKFSKELPKEEGHVKNNFKVREWKYYNKEGSIDSLKIYTINDSIDIRFPQCLFNKKEPCY